MGMSQGHHPLALKDQCHISVHILREFNPLQLGVTSGYNGLSELINFYFRLINTRSEISYFEHIQYTLKLTVTSSRLVTSF